MSLQSCSNSANDGASGSPSCSTSSSSMEIINLPLGIHSGINISNDDQQLLNIVNDLPAGPNPVTIISSDGAKVGPEYNITFHSIEGNTNIHISNYNKPEPPVQEDPQNDVPPEPQPLISDPVQKPTTGFGLIRRHFKALIILITAVTLACSVALIVLRFVGNGDDNKSIITTTTTEQPPSTTSTPIGHYLFSRDKWGARDPSTPLAPLEFPAKLMVIKHTDTKSCYDVSSCFTAMQDLQNRDVGEYGMPDIRYNFVVGGDGNIYEGRGWQTQNEQRNDSIDVAFLGNFSVDIPTPFVAATGPWMIVKGIAQVHLDWRYLKVVAHNQTEDTDSPGEYLYRELVTWQYYSNETFK